VTISPATAAALKVFRERLNAYERNVQRLHDQAGSFADQSNALREATRLYNELVMDHLELLTQLAVYDSLADSFVKVRAP
jgi:hypothetical protein